jgi:UDP:flavonoid glycosyltransferase YjiC (YdhE family)
MIAAMRILFATTPLDGHFRPLLPLARALRGRGHEIAFATAGSWHRYVEAEGFPALAAGADHATAKSVRLDGELAALAQLQGIDLRHYVFPYLFAEGHAPLKLTQLLEVARAWQPDAVVHETADLAAPAVAAALGLPSVHHAFGSMLPLATLRRAGQAVAPLWAGSGLEPDPYAGAFRGLYVDVVPPTFNDELPLCPSIRLRPALDGAAAPPAWLEDLRRPLVYATMGTVFNTPATFGPLLEALGAVDVGALVTVGRDVDPVELEPIPANVRVERFVPQDQVLPACAAVVTHGGSGTVLGALTAGVPMVVLPQGANQFDNAVRCQRAGVALTVKPEHATAEAIAAALGVVLADASYREGAHRIQAEIALMRPADEVAAAVEEHAGRR